MKFFFFILMLTSSNLLAAVITPQISLETSAPVFDFVIRQGHVWAGTANGEVLQINRDAKLISKISLPAIPNHWGEKVAPRIMSLDVSSDQKMIVFAAEDGVLYRIHEGKVVKTGFSTKAVIKKIALLSESKVLIALLSNEIIFFDLQQNKVLSTLSGGSSPLSDMAVSSDKKRAAVAGEAGIVTLIDTASEKISKQLKGGNVDNIYKIDFKNDFVITAGQDRRAIVYALDGKIVQRFDGTFLIYSVALSPSGSIAAAALDELNAISVFDVAKHQKIALAEGHQSTLNRIDFIDEKHFVSCADENKILFWELP
jgi:WD40 repeat protein